MVVGVYDIKTPNGTRCPNVDYYTEVLEANGIDYRVVCVDDCDFWSVVPQLKLFIMRFDQFDSNRQVAADIIPLIHDAYRVPCFPDPKTMWHYDDKIRQAMLASANNWPMIKSWYFYSRDAARAWAETTKYPVVFKLKGGAGSKNVMLVHNRLEANQLIEQMFGSGVLPDKFTPKQSLKRAHFSMKSELRHLLGNMYRKSKGLDADPYWARQKNYVLFQEFLPNNVFDTRVTVIGNRAFGFRRMVRQRDFRASGSGVIDYDQSKIDRRCIELAFNVSHSAGYQSMAYDFLFNLNSEPEFCEMSYTYSSLAIRNCPGFWDQNLVWHAGHFSPEVLHLQDALQNFNILGPAALQ